MGNEISRDFLTQILKDLLGPNLAGKFVVEVKLTTTVDAADLKDAQEKGLQYAKEHPEQLNAFAIKVDDLIHGKD